MMLPESVVYALENYTISGIRLYCDDSIKHEIMTFFNKTFREEWSSMLNRVEAKYGSCEEKESGYYPAATEKTQYGVLVHLNALDLRCSSGDLDYYCELDEGPGALERALESLKTTYPEVSYDGLIAFPWSDTQGSGVVQFEVSSVKSATENGGTYDFIGNLLGTVFTEETQIWERDDDPAMDGLSFAILEEPSLFESREELRDFLIESGAELRETISEDTDYLICNDIKQGFSHLREEKSLYTVPITEKELVSRFGDPEEYDIDLEEPGFWRHLRLYGMSDDADDGVFSELLDFLFAYRTWIGTDNLIRAAAGFRDMICENNETLRPVLDSMLRDRLDLID